MKPLHARYPFLSAAREAVDAAGVDLAAVVAGEPAVVERAVGRIEGTLHGGTVGESHRRTRVELLSYPVARVLVSLVDEHVLVHKYARAEAATAHERFSDELATGDDLRSTRTDRLRLADLLAEFDLAEAVHETPEGYRVGVGAYLEHAADQWGDEWRLVNRDLDAGEVPLSETDLYVFLRQAVRHRVADGLPFDVPDPVAEKLDAETEHVRELLAELELTRDIDTVVPDLFPPCMKHLLDRVQKGEHLEHHSRFAIAAFLTSIGMTTDEIVDLFSVNPGFGEEVTRYQVNHIRGETSPTQYSPPSCATMQSYGDCVNMDDRCERISHPMAYYEETLDDTDEEEMIDWREREQEREREREQERQESKS
jgi:DNA primase large subunit